MTNEVPLPFRTLYAELLDRSAVAAFDAAFAAEGFFTPKTVRGHRYWYFETRDGGLHQQRYVGPETPELLERIAQHRQVRDDRRQRRALVSALLRSARLPRPDTAVGHILSVLASAGVFRLRAVLIGTVAFQTYSVMLGTRLPTAALQTGDIDIAQDRAISIAVKDTTSGMLDVLRQADPTFRALPHIHHQRLTTSYATKELRVEFLTPNRGTDSDAPARLPALGTDAQQLRFLDFLIRNPEPVVVLHGAGILVQVPAPQRFALHKLIVARRRSPASGKSNKDIRQAEALLTVLSRNRPDELRDAWQEAHARGGKWRQYLLEGLALLNSVARDQTLRVVRLPRAAIPGVLLRFDDRRARHDSEHDVVKFLGRTATHVINCAISREALEDHFQAGNTDDMTHVTLFRKYRKAIEDMARAKYLTWPVEEPDAVLISTTDVPALRTTIEKAGGRAKPTRPSRSSK